MKLRLGLVMSTLLLGACSGGGSDSGSIGGGGGTNNTEPSVGILCGDGTPENTLDLAGFVYSGSLNYIRPLLSNTGFDFPSSDNNAEAEFVFPARCIAIEAWIANNDTLVNKVADGFTALDGSFAFNVPADEQIAIVVKAQMGEDDQENTRVVDNTQSAQLYEVQLASQTISADTSLIFDIPLGWTGNGYDDETGRLSAPFAILDTILNAQLYIAATDPEVEFQRLTVNWSPNNRALADVFGFSIEEGTLFSSFFTLEGGANMYLLGGNLDTDEYDTHVVSHEWWHFFENTLARSDSVGGAHDLDDFLDPSVAFSEGFANAFAGIVTGDQLYLDSRSISLNLVAGVDLETERWDPVSDVDVNSGLPYAGIYNESSVQEIIFDLLDPMDGNDQDNLAIDFGIIYDTFVEDISASNALNSIVSFLHFLNNRLPDSQVEALDARAEQQNIQVINAFDNGLQPYFNSVTTNGFDKSTSDIDNSLLATSCEFENSDGSCPAGQGNKWQRRVHFKTANAVAAGCYSIEIDASGDPNAVMGIDFGLSSSPEVSGESFVAAGSSRNRLVFAVYWPAGQQSFAVTSQDAEAQFSISVAPEANSQCDALIEALAPSQ